MSLANCVDEPLVRGTDGWVCTGDMLVAAVKSGGGRSEERQGFGGTAKEIAKREGHTEIVDLIEEHELRRERRR